MQAPFARRGDLGEAVMRHKVAITRAAMCGYPLTPTAGSSTSTSTTSPSGSARSARTRVRRLTQQGVGLAAPANVLGELGGGLRRNVRRHALTEAPSEEDLAVDGRSPRRSINF